MLQGVRIVFGAFVLLGIPSAAWAAGDLSDYLPVSTLTFLACDDTRDARDHFYQTEMGRLSKDAQVKSFYAEIRKRFFDYLARTWSASGSSVEALIEASTAFAIADVLVQKNQSACVLLLRLPDNAEAKKLLDTFDQSVAERAGERSESTIQDVRLVRHAPKKGKRPTLRFVKDGLCCISDDAALAETIVGLLIAPKKETQLSADRAFRHVTRPWSGVKSPPHLRWFWSAKRALTLPEGTILPGRGFTRSFWRILAEVGFDRVEACGGTIYLDVDGAEAVAKAAVYAPEPHHKLLGTIGFAQDDALAAPAWIPADVDVYASFNANFGLMKSQIGPLIDASYGAGVTSFYQDLKASLRKDDTFGVDIDRDFFDTLGKRVSYCSKIERARKGNYEAACTILEVADVSRLGKTFEKLLGRRSEVKKTTSGDGTLWKIPPSLDRDKRPAADPALDAAVALRDRKLFLASQAVFLERFGSGSSATTLTEDPSYRQLSEAVSRSLGKAPCFHLFFRPQEVVRAEHEYLEGGKSRDTLFGSLLDRANVSLLAELKLPPYDRLRRMLAPIDLQLVPEAEGWLGLARMEKTNRRN